MFIEILSKQTQHLSSVRSYIYFSTTSFGRSIRTLSSRNTNT